MSEPWEDFAGGSTATADPAEPGPWEDYDNGPWKEFRDVKRAALQKEMAAVRAEPKPSVYFGTPKGALQSIGQGLSTGVGAISRGLGHLGAITPPLGVDAPIPGESQGADIMNAEYHKKMLNPLALKQDIQSQPLTQAGAGLEQLGQKIAPPPQEAESVMNQALGGAAGLAPVMNPAAPIIIGLQSLGRDIEADFQGYKGQGLSDEEAAAKAIHKAEAAGMSQAAIWTVLPGPLRKLGEKYLIEKVGLDGAKRFLAGRVATGAEGAVLGGSSKAAENLATGEPVMEGVPQSALSLATLNAAMPRGVAKPPWEDFAPTGQPPAEPRPPVPEPPKPATPPEPTPEVTRDLIAELKASLEKRQIVKPAEQAPEIIEGKDLATPQGALPPAGKLKELLLEGVPRGDAELLLAGKRTVKEIVEGSMSKYITPAWNADIEQSRGGHGEAFEAGYNDAIARLDYILKHGQIDQGFEKPSWRIRPLRLESPQPPSNPTEPAPPAQETPIIPNRGTQTELAGRGEEAQTEPPKKKPSPFWIRPRSDGVPDILDDIQELGGLRKPSSTDTGGEYDGFKEAMTGTARLLAKKNATHTPDTLLEELHGMGRHTGIETADQLYDAIKAAVRGRQDLAATGGGHEEQQRRFWDAISAPKSTAGLEKINVQDLHVGDTFRVRGPGISHEELTVTHLDPDTGDIQVKDGPKLGRQDIPDGTEIWVQKGGRPVESPRETIAQTAPAPELGSKTELAEPSALVTESPKPANAPRLRSGEKGTGDLLQAEDAPFNLAGEKASDGDRIAREKAQAEKRAAEAKAIEAEQQPQFLTETPEEFLKRHGKEVPAPKAKAEEPAPPAEFQEDLEHQKSAEEPQPDTAETWLDKAIEATDPSKGGQLMEGVTGAPVWITKTALHGALKVIRAALKRGRQLADAITQGVEWLRHHHEREGFNEQEARQFLHDQYMGSLEKPAKNRASQAVMDLPDRGRQLFRWAQDGRRKLLARFKASPNRDFVAYSKDAADNLSVVFGKQAANGILHSLNRHFGEFEIDKRDQLREYALTFAVEAGGGLEGGDPKAKLEQFRQTILDSDARGSMWGRRALAAIRFAEENFDRLKPVAAEYQKFSDAENATENAHGHVTLHRSGGYVFHTQDVLENWVFPDTQGGSGGAPSPFRHIRDYATYADSIAAGLPPVNLSAINLLQHRITLGQRMINYGLWVDALRHVVDPTTELPLVTEPEVRKKADGTDDVTAPTGFVLTNFGGRQVAIHRGYSGLFGDLTDPSWMRKSALRETLMKVAGTTKHVVLLGDTFHLGRLAMWNAVSRMGVPRYKYGQILLDSTPSDIRLMVDREEIPRKWGDALEAQRAKLGLMLKAGLNVGNVGDNLYTDWVQKLPVAGTFNKWLFEKYQRGAMTEVGLLEFDRLKKTHPEASDEAIARMAARDINTRFGNLNSQSWIKSKTGQDLARLFILAPQWNESLIRSELGAVKQAAMSANDAAHGRLRMGMLAKGIGTAMLGTFIANQLINYATRGKPTWENEEEDPGAKISAWIPDYIGGGPGFFLNPMAVPAEITHLLMKATEKTGDFTKAARQFFSGRLNTISRPAWIFATREDTLGRKLRTGGEVLGAMGKAALPSPISGSAWYRAGKQGVTGEHEEAFPGQFEKQALQTFGIKTDNAPSAEQRINGLVKTWKHSQPNYRPEPEFNGSDYYELRKALTLGNMRDSLAALEDLRDKKTDTAIQKYFREFVRHPFTGSHAKEAQFLETLNPEQKRVYDKARAEREGLRDYFDAIEERSRGIRQKP